MKIETYKIDLPNNEDDIGNRWFSVMYIPKKEENNPVEYVIRKLKWGFLSPKMGNLAFFLDEQHQPVIIPTNDIVSIVAIKDKK